MPLITCPECGTEVSRSAKACPRCGASARTIAKGQRKPEKQVGPIGKILIGAAATATIVVAATSIISTPHTQTAPDATADELGQKRREATVIDATSLKQAMRDPESLVFEKILANDDGSVVCIRYHARNGFGGVNREIAVFAGGPGMTSATAWNHHCAHVALSDETDMTIRLMALIGH